MFLPPVIPLGHSRSNRSSVIMENFDPPFKKVIGTGTDRSVTYNFPCGFVELTWMSGKVACRSTGPSLRLTLWSRPVCVMVKVNVKYYVESLLPSLVAVCNTLLPGGFIFSNIAPPRHTHTAQLTQERIAANCRKFISEDEWPTNSHELNPIDHHV